jgi:hypothetical protein
VCVSVHVYVCTLVIATCVCVSVYVCVSVHVCVHVVDSYVCV